MYTNTNEENLKTVLSNSIEAFEVYKNYSIRDRVQLMRSVAKEIANLGDELIETAHKESNLPKARLLNEKGRTIFQWLSYADAIENGIVLDVRIDTALNDRIPPRPDIRKTMVPLGTVVVFGASNFPFAFSTAGGDTASAIAAGNSVIVKAHPAHPKTAELMGNAISIAIKNAGLPKGVFSQVYGDEKIGSFLVKHPHVAAVSFTGSFNGGKALFDLANERKEPIPVFAEMGSINPMFLLPRKLKNLKDLAAQYVASLTLGVGQFCTNPGLLVVQDSEGLNPFIDQVKQLINEAVAAPMLHLGIAKSYAENHEKLTTQVGVEIIASGKPGEHGCGTPSIARVASEAFLGNPDLRMEVFGPFGLIVVCNDGKDMEKVAKSLEGQLTISLLAEGEDAAEHGPLISILQKKCGRLIYNNFPTGVEVCLAMQHGGPFPASTDSRFTSVGADSIKRFMRPISYQNWPQDLLPLELQDHNPLNIQRTVNNQMTNNKL